MKLWKAQLRKKGGVNMKNLSAEMTRFGVTYADVQELLSCSYKTVGNKINGVTEFSVQEATKIRDAFFPGMRLEYLFAVDGEREGR